MTIQLYSSYISITPINYLTPDSDSKFIETFRELQETNHNLLKTGAAYTLQDSIMFKLPIISIFCALILAAGAAYAQPEAPFQPDIHTLGLWHFNEAEGDVARDTSGNGNNGELNGDAGWNAGIWGTALDLPVGEGDYVEVQDDESLHPQTFTLECWFFMYDDDDDGIGILAGKHFAGAFNSYLLGIDMDNGRAWIEVFTGEAVRVEADDLNMDRHRWHHIAGVYDGQLLTLFLDGELAAFTELEDDLVYNDNPVIFGSDPADPGDESTFVGRIDEVRLSDISWYQGGFFRLSEPFMDFGRMPMGGISERTLRINCEFDEDRFPGHDPWDLLFSFPAEEVVEDSRLMGVAYIDGQYYVSGGNEGDEVNLIYVFDDDGDLIRQFEQHNDERYGIRDLAWDGELLWGASGRTIYGFTTEGELETTFDGPMNPITCVAWDPDRELLWVCATTTNIHAMTREGEEIDDLQLDRQDLRIYGLAYWQEDPNDQPLYVFNLRRDQEGCLLDRFNPETGESEPVVVLDFEDEGNPGGIHIARDADNQSWILIAMLSISANDGGDRVVVWSMDDGIWEALEFELNDFGDDPDWLEIDPAAGVVAIDDAIDVLSTASVAELFPGEYERIVLMESNDPLYPELEIPVYLEVVGGNARLSGTVLDAENANPLPDAIVTVEMIGFQDVTDERGHYEIGGLPAGNFRATAEHADYLPFRSEEFEIEDDRETILDVVMLHATCEPNHERLEVTLEQNQIEDVDVEISNSGNGQLQFTIERRFPLDGVVDTWDERASIEASRETNDDRLQGVEFDGENFYISGGNNGEGRGLIYVFNREGEYIRSFEQFYDSPWGMRDLAWDGRLLWGSDDNIVYGFTPDGELDTQFEGPLEINRAITWDPERELLWVCDVSTDLYGVDRRGNIVERLETSPELHIYGLGTYNRDPDGCAIYAFCKDGDFDSRVCKMDMETGRWIFVTDFETREELKAGGMSITGVWDAGSWVLAGVLQGRAEVLDQLVVWHIETRTHWLAAEPLFGTVDPDGSETITVTFSETGFPSGVDLTADLLINHNGRGNQAVLPVLMRIDYEESAPNNRDKKKTPDDYRLISVYPNPFNSVTAIEFQLSLSEHVSIKIYSIDGSEVATLTDGRLNVGRHKSLWEGNNNPAGVYICRIETAGWSASTKLVVVR